MTSQRPGSQPIRSSILAGRTSELSEFDAIIDRVAAGQGRSILLSGEAGIGKSRLIGEVRQEFRQRTGSSQVLQGNCFEVDRDYPFAPIIDLLNRISPSAKGEGDGLVNQLLEDIERDPGDWQEEGLEARRFARRFSRYCQQQAEPGPLLVIMEDLHWADEATLELVLHLTRSSESHPILVLASFRIDEVDEALQHVLATLDRERRATELVLSPLGRTDVDTMLRGMFGQAEPIRPDFLEMVHRLTDGNPFFIEEVVRSLIDSGDIYLVDGRWQRKEASQLRIPRSVQDAVWQRAQRASTDARDVLSVAAVSGRHFSFQVLRDLTGMTDERMLMCLRELMDQQLIDEESADLFAFRHALTREAIYASLLGRERRTLHGAVAEAVERLVPDNQEQYVSELAYHYEQAEIWEKALTYAVRAGNRSRALYSSRSAVEHYSRALRARRNMSLPPDQDLLRNRGIAYSTLGHFEEAHRDFEARLEITRQAGDRNLEWQTLIDLGKAWAGRDFDYAGRYFQNAYDLAVEMEDAGAIAQSLMQIGYWQVNAERLDEAEATLSRARAMFEEIGDRHGVAEATDLLGIVADLGGDAVQMYERMGKAAELYRELDERKGLAAVLPTRLLAAGGFSLFGVMVPTVRVPLDEAIAGGEEAVQLAREIEWRSGESYALLCQGFHYGARGDYARSLELADESLAIAREIDHGDWTIAGSVLQGMLFSDLLNLSSAIEHFGAAAALAKDRGTDNWHRMASGYLGGAKAMAGDLEGAEAILTEFGDDLPPNTLGFRIVWLGRIRLAMARGDHVAALGILDHMMATARNYTDESDIPALTHARGVALMKLDRHIEAERSFRFALDGARTRGLLPMVWRCHVSLGDLLGKADRSRRAISEYLQAQNIVDELADGIPDESLREMFLSRVADMLPKSVSEDKGDTLFGLTPREREVASLLAKGMSNREIADALYVGERTIETHVGNILTKLEFNSRIQVATWMTEISS